MIDYNTNKIDWTLLDKIENPEQKAFFLKVKKNLEAGKEIDPKGLVQSIGQLMGGENPEMYKGLKNFTEKMDNLTSGLKNFNV